MKSTLFSSLIVFSALFLISGCATESAPTGGKEDTEPPQVKLANPPDKTTRFTGNKIQIQFNEFIQNTGFANTLVSPPMEPKPVINAAGKTLTIKLKGELKPNTTYTINFGDDLKDYNQGNILGNFTYVFSTGDYIDSQKISGKVTAAKDGNAFEKALVMLYRSEYENPVLKENPLYFAKTNKQGEFTISNIKAGEYEIFALKDENLNYIYDQPTELIGFADSRIILGDTGTPKIELTIFKEPRKRISFQGAKSLEPGKIILSYNGPFSNLKLNSGLFSGEYFMSNYDTKDTSIIWFSNYYIKSDSIILTANDTIADTARIDLKTLEKDSVLQLKKYALSILNQTSKSTDGKAQPNIQALYGWLKFQLNRAVMEINKDKALQISEDSTPKTIIPEFRISEKTKQSLEINFERKENTDYTLAIPDSAFRDIFGLWNSKMVLKFKTNSKDAFGNIHFTFHPSDSSKYYVLKLLSGNNEPVKIFSLHNEKERKETISKIPAGTYRISVIEDTNNNGTWDTGNLLQHRQPEKIFNFRDSYQLKGGWDLDVEVKF